MPPSPTNLPDLTADWPEDPANADLARLAQDLAANRPQLPQISLDRIQVRMRQEIQRLERNRRLRTAAALVLVALALTVGIFKYLSSRPTTIAPNHPATRKDELPIQDTFPITLPPTTPTAPANPLIDLNQFNEIVGPTTRRTQP